MIQTIKIKHGKDYAVINASDFDPEKHEPWVEGLADADLPPVEAPAPPPAKARRAKPTPSS